MFVHLGHDIRHAVRGLRRAKSFTALAVAALAIGIGANTAIFSLVDTVLLRALPFPDGDRLVTLWSTDSRIPDGFTPVSPADYADLRAQTRSFEGFAIGVDGEFNLTGGGDPEL